MSGPSQDFIRGLLEPKAVPDQVRDGEFLNPFHRTKAALENAQP